MTILQSNYWYYHILQSNNRKVEKSTHHTSRVQLSEYEFRQSSSETSLNHYTTEKILCYRLRNKSSSLSTKRFKILLICGDLQKRDQLLVKIFSC